MIIFPLFHGRIRIVYRFFGGYIHAPLGYIHEIYTKSTRISSSLRTELRYASCTDFLAAACTLPSDIMFDCLLCGFHDRFNWRERSAAMIFMLFLSFSCRFVFIVKIPDLFLGIWTGKYRLFFGIFEGKRNDGGENEMWHPKNGHRVPCFPATYTNVPGRLHTRNLHDTRRVSH